MDFRAEDGQLLCEIIDDGVGIDAAVQARPAGHKHNSVGIRNVENRIRLLNEKYHIKSSLEIRDRKLLLPPARGTRVRLTLPLEINES